jgi:16S rRNA (adenine1518-N6/adenine1519-N6)-dimethyltransferase
MSTYLGQNFLHDSKVQQYIAEKIAGLCADNGANAIIEIGPGKGAITKRIKDIAPHFLVIEKDTTMQEALQKHISVEQIIFADVLETKPEDVLADKSVSPSQTVVVGNLPYYITSPILRKFFGYGKQDRAAGFFMMQKEVGDKIHSDAGKKSYLWWLLNHSYDVRYAKTVPAKAFRPAPRVQSCLIALTRKEQPWPIAMDKLLEFLEVFAPFSRKTMGKIAKMTKTHFVVPEDIASKRLEDCGVDDLVRIIVHG